MAVDAVRRLAGLPPVAALMLTVRSRADGVAQAQRLGFASCLVKPSRRQQIADAVIAAIGATASAPVADRAEPAKPASRSLRVLVAEDNEVNQKVVVRMLERLGHHPAVASNGREAVEALSAATFDLVLMDCQMPEMDGFEATRRIRALTVGRRHLPILALTANASDADRQRCLEAGMDGHLAKPLKLERLAEALASWTTPARVPVGREATRVVLRKRDELCDTSRFRGTSTRRETGRYGVSGVHVFRRVRSAGTSIPFITVVV